MRKRLNKSEIKRLNSQLLEFYGVGDFLDKKEQVDQLDEVLVVQGRPMFFLHEGKPVPTLRLLQQRQFLKTVTVDMGAVRFVAQGADVMRPGITIFDDVAAGEFVTVVDETHRKPLAVCECLISAEELKSMKSGKALKNLHYVGDAIWNSA
jgi:PUA-domain protein